MNVEKRDPGIVLVLALFTCGFYLIYWYFKMYEELEMLTGETPTGNNFWLDFFLNIVSCTLFGIWVDYKISEKLNELQRQRGMVGATDSMMMAVVLDIAAYVTGMFTNYITSAIQQDQLNKLLQHQPVAGATPAQPRAQLPAPY
jgi:hypothetical protein